MKFTINIDTGGTFTDGFITRGDEYQKVKVETTPHDLTVCFSKCIEEAAKKFEMGIGDFLAESEIIRFSTTISTNSLIQRTGPKLGLIISRSLLSELTRDTSPIIDFLVNKEMVIALDEEIDDSGEVKKPLSEEEARRAVRKLQETGAKSLVISLKNSQFNPEHERLIKGIVLKDYPRYYLGYVPTMLSSEVCIRPDENLVANTSVLNAYIHQDLAEHLYKADDYVRNSGFPNPLLIVHNDGGAVRVAKTKAVNTYSSGPVAGLMGSLLMSRMYNLPNVATLDLGGTSLDLGIITDGTVEYNTEPVIHGIPINIPMMNVSSTGSGGGSIASVNTNSKEIQVGPESAGAVPGPACYGLGGNRATVTDADVVLGYIDPDYFLGGRRELDKNSSYNVIKDQIADPLGISVEKAAYKIKEVLEFNSSEAVRRVIEKKGKHPQEFSVFAFGGASGLHCCGIADYAGTPKRIYTFPTNSVFSACGLSTMDVVHTYETRKKVILRSAANIYLEDLEKFNDVVGKMEKVAYRDMRGEGFPAEAVQFDLEMEISSGKHTEMIGFPQILLKSAKDVQDISRLFLRSAKDVQTVCDTFTQQCSEVLPKENITVNVFKLRAICPVTHYRPAVYPSKGENAGKALKGKRPAFWGEGFKETNVYDRMRLESGNVVEGPAIIEDDDSTYLIPEGRKYRVDEYLSGIIEKI